MGRDRQEAVLTRVERDGPFVPLGVPGAFATYRLSGTDDLESDLARVAPFIAPFEASARSRPGRPTRHRLIALVEATEADLRAHRDGQPGRHLVDVVELGQVVGLLTEWQDDPAGVEVVRDLKDPGVYAHSILVLAAARMLRDSWHNAARIVKKQPARSPDLTVTTEHGDVAVELKAPRELDGGDWVRTKGPGAVAADVLRRSGAQRRTANASLLVVAGYRVPDVARGALASELATRLVLRPSVCAACVLSLGAHPEDQAAAATLLQTRMSRPLTHEETQAILSLPVSMAVMRNTHYSGPVPITSIEEGGAGLRLPTRPMIIRRAPPAPGT